ncbi:MAG TPA: hypothetical protein VFA18_13005 [Gemmataceae bacterium]|nr:hypothetical protein [Gemmataceae bacterium]
MCPHLTRLLFLLLLLAIDWYADTSLGSSPTSADMRSTDAYCRCLAHKQLIGQSLAVSHRLVTAPPVDSSSQSRDNLFTPLGEAPGLGRQGSDLTHLFMSMQC